MRVVESCLLLLILVKLNRVKMSLCNSLRWRRMIETRMWMLLTVIMRRVARKEKRMF